MFPIRDDTPRFSTPIITYFIIVLNVLVFMYELSMGAQSQRALNALVAQFGVIPRHEVVVVTGQTPLSPGAAVLPIFTSMFLHGGWLHIIFNMWWLWIFGDNIEDYLGHFKYLIFYLASGFAAALVHIVLNLNSRVPTVGASGAIAGVMGGYIILYPRAKVLTLVFLIVFITFWWLPAWFFLGYWFLVQFLSGAAMNIAETSQSSGGVAVWAHVGGFVAGILLIKLMPARPRRFSYSRDR
ncbi:MAG: rhomboid family intramembrane serine protease [Acidobacteria bacterium]|nr:rhomboid family intramembrane serine protease [Acidobacteriota bacterium]MBV9484249.1 rhomboid family intramembrane serine protease [Acidobacteriota bacterium]